MREQERFRWSLWPVCAGWIFAAWVAWHGISDLILLLGGQYPPRGFVFGSLSVWPREWQMAVAAVQSAAALLAVPSLIGFLSRRVLLTIGRAGLTFDRWTGWRRIGWADIVKLEFSFGDAVFHLRDGGRLSTLRFRPWTIGLDSDGFRDLIERHQPRLTPDEDDGQPWGRSSSFNA
jgi:Bacterial PH domain